MDGILLGLTTPSPGREKDLLQWYRDVHFPELLSLEGFSEATLYRFDRTNSAGFEYGAIYHTVPGGLQTAMGAIAEGRSAGSVTVAPSGLYQETAQAWWGSRV